MRALITSQTSAVCEISLSECGHDELSESSEEESDHLLTRVLLPGILRSHLFGVLDCDDFEALCPMEGGQVPRSPLGTVSPLPGLAGVPPQHLEAEQRGGQGPAGLLPCC